MLDVRWGDSRGDYRISRATNASCSGAELQPATVSGVAGNFAARDDTTQTGDAGEADDAAASSDAAAWCDTPTTPTDATHTVADRSDAVRTRSGGRVSDAK
jgi:hypothetical protein